jgi:hypothetical protein
VLNSVIHIDVSGAPARETFWTVLGFFVLNILVFNFFGAGVLGALLAFFVPSSMVSLDTQIDIVRALNLLAFAFVAAATLQIATSHWFLSRRLYLPHYDATLAQINTRIKRMSGSITRRTRGWIAANILFGALIMLLSIAIPKGEDFFYWSDHYAFGETLNHIVNTGRGAPDIVLQFWPSQPAYWLHWPKYLRGVPEFIVGVAFVLNGSRIWSNRGGFVGSFTAWLVRVFSLPVLMFLLYGPLCLTVLALYIADSRGYLPSPPPEGIFQFALIISAIGVGWLLWKFGEFLAGKLVPLIAVAIPAMDNPTLRQERSRDPRAPVLYLRSFYDDQQREKLGAESRLEKAFSREARLIGPFVAVGAPGSLRTRGAARAYLQGDEWRRAVLELMAQARIIVVVAHWTEGLVWELSMILERGHAHKLVLLLPSADKYHDDRCAWVRACFRGHPCAALLQQANLSHAMALQFQPGPKLVVISGADELGAAFTVASYGAMIASTTSAELLEHERAREMSGSAERALVECPKCKLTHRLPAKRWGSVICKACGARFNANTHFE